MADTRDGSGEPSDGFGLVIAGESALTSSDQRPRRGFVPGIWLAKKLGRDHIVLSEILTAAVLATIGVLIKAAEISSWFIAPGLALVALSQYVSKSRSELDRVEKLQAEDERDRAKKSASEAATLAIRRYKSQVAGPLAFVCRAMVESQPLTELRGGYLAHAVDVARAHLGLSLTDDTLSATWAVPSKDFYTWEVVAYDRYQANRQPHQPRPLRDGIPGAAEAILTGEHTFIADTHDETLAEHFPVKPPYRSILSVPARIRNVRSGNVTIHGSRNTIVGVLNLDCKQVEVLTEENREDLYHLLQDAAFLLAMIELLGGKNGDKS